MRKEEWNQGMDHIDPAIVDDYVEQKDTLRRKRRMRERWLRVGAAAACLALVVGTVLTVPRLLGQSLGMEPYFPDGEAWSPVIHDSVRDVVLDAEEVGQVFAATKDYNGTNQYTKIYATDPKYLGILPLPEAEYLPIYKSGQDAPSKDQFQAFIQEYLDEATAFFGFGSQDYSIEKDHTWDGSPYYKAEIGEGQRRLSYLARLNILSLRYYSISERRMKLQGEYVSVLESDTDDAIREKLAPVIKEVCKAFGKNYTDVKIRRSYHYDQMEALYVYLYTPEETIFPDNFSDEPMVSDYVTLTLYTDWGKGSFCHWGGSKDEAFLSEISLCETIEPWDEYYRVTSKSRMLTLEEAEELLEKGYVFGGHSCPLCMAAQPEVDFEDYTGVSVEYVSDIHRDIYIPFYAFYKYIGESDDGVGIYAMTYVPAVEVTGYKEYFENQKDDHRSFWDVVG